ncbi:MAG: GNAT family N-acetyltransferase [Acidobacteria bacterium]|nr:GNAT family N-acetyltransferase [Acidobacteriota bacterium]
MPVNEGVFSKFPTMATDRLVLGPHEAADAPEAFRFYSSEQSLRFVPRDFFCDPQEGVEKVLGFAEAFEEHSAIWWTFRVQATGEFVGYGGLFDISTEDHNAEVGYGIHPEYWGKGFASEAVRSIVDFGFEKLRLHRIFGLIDPDNGASMRVLEKLGFQKEGVLRDNAFARERYWDHCLYARVGE